MNDVPLLRNSERMDFRRCPQRWKWRYWDHLVPAQFSTGPLVFGSLGHLALASHYIPGNKRGRNPVETWDELTLDYIDQVKNEVTGYVDDEIEMTWDDARQLGHTILTNYMEEYGNDDAWEVIWCETPGKQLIPNPNDKKSPIVNYCFTFDLIIRDHSANGRIRMVDHKFMKTIQTKHLYLDTQPGGYIAIGSHLLRKMGLIGEKEFVRDLIYNFVRKQKYPEGKHRNEFGEWMNKTGGRMKVQPSPFFLRYPVPKTAAERNQQIKMIGIEALHMKAFRTGKLQVHKNPTRDCFWDCQFFTLCGIHESGGDVEGTIKALYKTEDPYAPYYEDVITPERLRAGD